MIKILLWGLGNKFEYYWQLGIEKIIKIQDSQILAIIDSDPDKGVKKYGYDVTNKDRIADYNYDKILVTTDYMNFQNICKDVKKLQCAQIDKIIWFQTYLEEILKRITFKNSKKNYFSLCNTSQKHISIMGECNLRDAFSYQYNENHFLIDNYIRSNSPLVMNKRKVSEVIHAPVTINDFTKSIHPVFSKWRFIDIEKLQFQTLAQNKSEWMLVNLVEAKNSLIHLFLLKKPDINTFISRIEEPEVPDEDMYKKPKFNELDQLCVSPDIFSQQEIVQSIEFYADQLLKLYDEKHIICVVNYPIKEYLSNEWTIKAFEYTGYEKDLAIIKKCYQIFLDKVKCHVLYMPENALGYEFHKWGISPQHYAPQFYDWLYESVCVIVSESGTEREMLQELKNKYEQCFELMRQKFQNNEEGILPLLREADSMSAES